MTMTIQRRVLPNQIQRFGRGSGVNCMVIFFFFFWEANITTKSKDKIKEDKRTRLEEIQENFVFLNGLT